MLFSSCSIQYLLTIKVFCYTLRVVGKSVKSTHIEKYYVTPLTDVLPPSPNNPINSLFSLKNTYIYWYC